MPPTPEPPLEPALAEELEAIRARGRQVIGPGPVAIGQASPTMEMDRPGAGMHVLIEGERGLLIEGFGGTASEAVRDALAKLAR